MTAVVACELPAGFWDDAPEGERYARVGGSNPGGYVITTEAVKYKSARDSFSWGFSIYSPEEIRESKVHVDATSDLHPLIPGREAIAWADERLRDPEVAGWTKAQCQGDQLLVISADGRDFYTAKGGIWVGAFGTHAWLADYRRAANTNTEPENNVTDTENETLDELREKLAQQQTEFAEFKARVYTVGKAAAVEHGWCSVFDTLMDELGIEAPKPKWPAPGKLFRMQGEPDSVLRISVSDTHYRLVRMENTAGFNLNRDHAFVTNLNADHLVILDV